jgi:hypothetical protein
MSITYSWRPCEDATADSRSATSCTLEVNVLAIDHVLRAVSMVDRCMQLKGIELVYTIGDGALAHNRMIVLGRRVSSECPMR